MINNDLNEVYLISRLQAAITNDKVFDLINILKKIDKASIKECIEASNIIDAIMSCIRYRRSSMVLPHLIKHDQQLIQVIEEKLKIRHAYLQGKTLLMLAIIYKHPKLVTVLLKFKVDVNAKDDNGMTALMYAAKHSSYINIKHLLEHKADLECVAWRTGDYHESTALTLAIETKNKFAIISLINGGANVNYLIGTKEFGTGKIVHYLTLLNYHCKYDGKVGISKLLLQAGNNVNTPDLEGKTPLMFYASHRRKKGCKLLISYGANLHATDKHGCTALIYAAKAGRGHETLLEYFLSQNPDVDLLTKPHDPFSEFEYVVGKENILPLDNVSFFDIIEDKILRIEPAVLSTAQYVPHIIPNEYYLTPYYNSLSKIISKASNLSAYRDSIIQIGEAIKSNNYEKLLDVLNSVDSATSLIEHLSSQQKLYFLYIATNNNNVEILNLLSSYGIESEYKPLQRPAQPTF